MKYDKLIETVNEIILNPKIEKNNLTLTYKLPYKHHLLLQEEIFYKFNDKKAIFEPTDVFEVEVLGILVVFLKNENK